MTLGLWPQMAGIIDMIPSLPIHSSVLIPLVAGLFLAALILRAQRLPKQSGQQNLGLTTRQAPRCAQTCVPHRQAAKR